MSSDENVFVLLKKVLRRITILATMLVATIVFVVTTYILQRSSDLSSRRQSRHALCVEIEKLKLFQRLDKMQQLKESQQYLREHPQGTPGISRKLIVRSIEHLRDQIKSLQSKSC